VTSAARRIACVVLVAPAAAAPAAGAATLRVDLATGLTGYAGTDASERVAGTFRGTGLAPGGLLGTVRLRGADARGEMTLYDGRGSLRLRHRSTVTPPGGERGSFRGTADAVGGTGRYAGARGRLAFTGGYGGECGWHSSMRGELQVRPRPASRPPRLRGRFAAAVRAGLVHTRGDDVQLAGRITGLLGRPAVLRIDTGYRDAITPTTWTVIDAHGSIRIRTRVQRVIRPDGGLDIVPVADATRVTGTGAYRGVRLRLAGDWVGSFDLTRSRLTGRLGGRFL
jgi:hypothetical protein